MKHLFSLRKRFFSKALSQESAIVLLAFISTTLVFGFIIYNYVSSIPNYESIKVTANSILLYYREGHVWRIIVPVQVLGDNIIDFRSSKIKVSLSVGDGSSTKFLNISGVDRYSVYGGRIFLGDVREALRSCTISVEHHGENSVRRQWVNVHVYFDEHSRLHVVVDDDDDGVIDSSYLISFTENVNTDVSLDLDSTYVLSVEKNSVLPIDYLEYILAGSIKPDAQIRMVLSNNSYYVIEVADLARSIQELVVLTSISRGNNDYYLSSSENGLIIILVPEFLDLHKGDKISLSIYLPNTHPISGEVVVSRDLNGTGLLVLSGLKNSGGR